VSRTNQGVLGPGSTTSPEFSSPMLDRLCAITR